MLAAASFFCVTMHHPLSSYIHVSHAVQGVLLFPSFLFFWLRWLHPFYNKDPNKPLYEWALIPCFHFSKFGLRFSIHVSPMHMAGYITCAASVLLLATTAWAS